MNDVLVPDWIKREEAQIAQEKTQKDADKQRELAASIFISSDGPKFWQTLLERFAINTDALPKIDLSGQTIKVSAPERGEQHWRIAVSRPGIFPSFTHTDVFYSLGSGVIRCHTLEGQAAKFTFCVVSRRQGQQDIEVIQDGDSDPMDAGQMAAFIVKGMAGLVRRR
jgi:hypothetical protein